MALPPPPYRAPGWAARPAQPATLLTHKGETEAAPRITLSAKGILFGRKVDNAPPASLRLDHESISREHAAIVYAFSGEAFVVDLDSRYGTFLDGNRLQPRAYTPLQDGCKIRLGESTRTYIFTRTPPPPPRDAPAAATRPPGQASSAGVSVASVTDGSTAAHAKPTTTRPQPPPLSASQPPDAGDDDDVDPMANYVDESDDDGDDDGAEGSMRGAATAAGDEEASRRKELKRLHKAEEKARRRALKEEMRAEEKARLRALKRGGGEVGGAEGASGGDGAAEATDEGAMAQAIATKAEAEG